jgi:hypothetical protein
MKPFTLNIIIVILLLPIQIFSQSNNKLNLNPDNLLQERIISKSIQNGQIMYPLKSENFKDKESRIILNKTILDNGFLLIEELWQSWDGSNWVNDFRETYTYDGNSNLIETIEQDWDGANWINEWKGTYTYDINNNMIELIEQSGEGNNWSNVLKTTWIYDDNKNMTEMMLYDWTGSNWVSNERHRYEYNINNYMI